ncbi:MAG: PUR family DNA/RNA-binding protein [Aquificaceae bacterium]|nr:PUR family DNA/RNA-binding protein [Aquificaceae bacterium]MDW8236783.1 DUF3276 family protein [Aquificaceae bacterium]
MENGKVFSKRLVAGKRTYFFDVKKGKDGSAYLVISEQRDDKKVRLMVFEDRLDAFLRTLEEAVQQLKREVKS